MKPKQSFNYGPLSIEEIAEGISECLQNAHSSYKDAIILLIFQRHNKAFNCLSIACEELGKAGVLSGMSRILPNADDVWKEAWKSFRSHQSKGVHAAIQTVPDKYRTSFDNIMFFIPKAFELATEGEKSRQASVYVDFSKETESWVSPSRINISMVLRKFFYTRRILKNMRKHQKLGFYSVKALNIIHEEMASAYSTVMRKKEVTYDD